MSFDFSGGGGGGGDSERKRTHEGSGGGSSKKKVTVALKQKSKASSSSKKEVMVTLNQKSKASSSKNVNYHSSPRNFQKNQTNKYVLNKLSHVHCWLLPAPSLYTTQPTLHLYGVCKTVWVSKNKAYTFFGCTFK